MAVSIAADDGRLARPGMNARVAARQGGGGLLPEVLQQRGVAVGLALAHVRAERAR